MLDFTKEKSNCMGCSACYVTCPVQCIKMEPDEEGFLYPTATEKCIHCEKCKRICPIATPNVEERGIAFQKSAWCAVTKKYRIWKRSSSGGAFSEICEAFGDDETIICGAAWDGLRVHHVCVKGVRNIAALCKSKYVASNPKNVFAEIKQYLKDGKKVIFCGTPCQVAGLKRCIGNQDKNLLLIDLICHGVGSQKVFEVCVNSLSKQFENSIVGYEFRAKGRVYETDYLQKITSDNGNKLLVQNDPYMQLFLKQLSLRPSCGGNCHFRIEDRESDITIADFKGLSKVFPKLHLSKRNFSSIIIHTEKGNLLLEQLKKNMVMYPCTIDDIKEHNPLFYRQTWIADNRDDFFADFISNEEEAISKWCCEASEYKLSWKGKIWCLLPNMIRRQLIRFVQKKHSK